MEHLGLPKNLTQLIEDAQQAGLTLKLLESKHRQLECDYNDACDNTVACQTRLFKAQQALREAEETTVAADHAEMAAGMSLRAAKEAADAAWGAVRQALEI